MPNKNPITIAERDMQIARLTAKRAVAIAKGDRRAEMFISKSMARWNNRPIID